MTELPTLEQLEAEGLKSTGFHYAFNPGDQEKGTCAASVRCDPAKLIARRVKFGNHSHWTLFLEEAGD